MTTRPTQARRRTRRRGPGLLLRAFAWTVSALIALPVLLVVAVLVLLNTDFGRAQVVRYLPGLTGGVVHVAGIGGRFPDRIRIASVTLHDEQGTWLTIDNLAVDWSPLDLLKGDAHVARLAADAVDLPRMPAPSPPAHKPAPSSSGSFSLPVRVDVDAISIARFAIGAPVATVPAVVSVAGNAHAVSLTDATAHLALQRLDGEGTYDLDAAIKAQTIDASLRAHEPPGGLIGGLAGLQPVGAIAIDASVVGPRDALAAKLAADIGPFHATANGVVETIGNRADLRVDATAPQMQLQPGLGWRSVELRAQVSGAFDAPSAIGTLAVTGLSAFGAAADTVSAGIIGNQGDVTLLANAIGLRIPGPKPDLLAQSPLTIRGHIALNQPDTPVTATIEHALLTADIKATLGAAINAAVTLRVPDIAPFAAVANVDLRGQTALDINANVVGPITNVAVTGTIGVTGGLAPIPGLLGDAAHIDAAGTLNGDDITVDRLKLDGRTLTVDAKGGQTGGKLDTTFNVALSDLSVAEPQLQGHVAVTGHASGAPDDLALDAHAVGEVAAQGVPSGPLDVDVAMHGLPNAPAGTVAAHGALDGAPVDVRVAASRATDGATHVAIDSLSWKSLRGSGTLDLAAGAVVPTGNIVLAVGNLADANAISGLKLQGSADAKLDATQQAVTLALTAHDAGLVGTASVGSAQVMAHVSDPLGTPSVDATATITRAGGGTSSVESARLEAHVTNARADPAGTLTLQASGVRSGTNAVGSVNLDATFTNALSLPAIDATATVDRITAGDSSVGSARVQAHVTNARAEPSGTLTVQASDVRSGANAVGTVKVEGRFADALTNPTIDATMTAKGIRAGSVAGSARLTARGPQTALAVTADANLTDATATAALTLDAKAKTASVTRLDATYKGEAAKLLAPVRVAFGDGISIDRLRLGVQQAVIEVAGRLSPTLDLTAKATNVTPALAKPFVPNLNLQGTLEADAKLTGSRASPSGTMHIEASGLRVPTGNAAALPPARLTATATLQGTSARIDAHADAGPRISLTATGTAPIGAGPINLQARGRIDLAVLDPIVAAAGQRVRGIMSLDLGIVGTASAPRPTGFVTLTDGEVQDFARGVHLHDIDARLDAVGDTVRLTSLTAKAGTGTVSASGSVGVTGDKPVNIMLTMRGAQPVASDLLTATIDADLSLRGALTTKLAASGSIGITRADIRVPERLPATVVVLNVRNAGAPPPPPAPPSAAPTIDLALGLHAQRIFVRGRGLNVELAGEMKLAGTAARPVPSGGFQMERGSFSLAGQSLIFTQGDVSFSGGSLTDPSLDFTATTVNGTTTASLNVGGTASHPTITLSSSPPLPQDEILAQILFHRSASELSPFELASAAAALASFTGVGGGIGDPLAFIRSGLGLDTLSVGSGANGAPAVTAGRYVAPGVFLGARQNASGSTQATVQVDLYKGLKLEGTAGTGTGTATGSSNTTFDPSSSGGTGAGITYQFQY